MLINCAKDNSNRTHVYHCCYHSLYHYIYSWQNVTLASITEDKELKDFFKELVSTYLHRDSDLARIDILNCPVEDDPDGKQMIQTLSKQVGVPVYTSKARGEKNNAYQKHSAVIQPITSIGCVFFLCKIRSIIMLDINI